MTCPRCGTPNLGRVCERCGLLTPAAIDEVQHVMRAMDERLRCDNRLGALPFADVFRDVAAGRGVLARRDVESLLRRVARAHLRGTDVAVPEEASTALLHHDEPAPEEDVRAFHASAIRLKLGQLTFAVPFCLVMLLLAAVAPDWSLFRLLLAGFGLLWVAVIVRTWMHLRRKDPIAYWRQECGTEAVTSIDPAFPAEGPAATGLDAARDAPTRLVEADRISSAPPQGVTRTQLADVWYVKGIEAQQAGRFQEAVALLYRAVEVAPSELTLKASLAVALVLASCQASSVALETEGFRMFDDVLAVQRDPTTLFNYAQALRMTGRSADASAVAQELLRMTPDDPDLLELIAELGKSPTVH